MKKLIYGVLLTMLVGLTGCIKNEVKPNMTKLSVNFADSKWNSEKVPSDEVCSDFNLKGAKSPRLLITNLPKRTNKIILTFSDDTFSGMNNGGHGVISYEITGYKKSIVIPSISSETFTLAKNFKSVKSHRGTQWGKTAGAYLAPCSGGRGNTYSVKIEAIHDFNIKDKKPLLLGSDSLVMGIF